MANGVIEEILRIKVEGNALPAVATEAKAAAAAVQSVRTAAASTIPNIVNLGGSAAVLSRHLGSLAFQLNDVATMAALGANPLQILASQGGQIAQIFAQAGGVMPVLKAGLTAVAGAAAASAGPILAVAGVAATLYASYRILTFESDRAAEKTARLTSEMEALKAAMEASAEASARVDAFIAASVGSVDTFTVALIREEDAYRKGRQAQEDLLQAKVDEEAALRSGTAVLNEHDLAYERALNALADYQEETQDHVTTLEGIASGLRRNKQLTDDAAAADKAAAEAKRRSSEMIRMEREAFSALQKELARELEVSALVRQDMIEMADRMFTPEVDEAAQALRAFDTALAAINFQDRIDDTAAMAMAVADLTRAFSRGAITKEQYDAAMAMGAATSAGGTSSSKGGAAGAIAGALSNPLGAIAGIHPIAGAIVAGIQAAANLPETLNSITEMFTKAIANVAKGGMDISAFIGDILGEILPAAIKAVPMFIEGLIQGIPLVVAGVVKLLPEIIIGLVQAYYLLIPRIIIAFVAMLTNPETWKALWQSIIDAFKQIVLFLTPGVQKGEVHGDGLFKQGGALDKLEHNIFHPAESFDTGTDFVTRTGLAVVHQGERIVTSNGGSSGRTAAMAGGGGTTITMNVTGGVIDPRFADHLIRELNRHLGTNGRRLTWASGS